MDKNTERRYHSDEIKIEQRSGDDKGITLRGYAAVFNSLSEDLGGFREQIVPGAFKEAIETDDIRALLNHDANFVLGRNRAKTLELKEDARGLAVVINAPDTSFARDLVVSMERGDITQMSFAFRVKPNGEDWAKNDDGVWIRSVKRVRLYDVSPVTYAAYTATDIAVRSLDQFRQAHPEVDPAAYLVQAEQRRRALQLIS